MRAPVVLAILAANAAVYLLWSMQGESAFMVDNFLVSWTALKAGRFWTLLTSAFSHNLFWHFFLNMLVFASFGPIVEQTLGSMRFLRFYLTAAIISSLAHAMVSAFILEQPAIPALGASGAISAVVVLFSCIYPRAQVFLLGIIPIPALIGAILFVSLDALGLFGQSQGVPSPIGHGAHLGGAAIGLLYFLFVYLPRRRALRSHPTGNDGVG